MKAFLPAHLNKAKRLSIEANAAYAADRGNSDSDVL